ncbi:selenocysteine-specific translation elongation factor [Crenobacter sp. SG2305]|uniref:selenocysteine-specific translation elongation factor n=1 Tax=Crenobacter oryzisoli TaxID=3056844 RepID=UPI0025AB4A34|nr:selenocysteine-specific translation elongation factor [Crenobacter sp. SG2305]MDN0082323.1 selenocysteine-specific translation elongation factor [Crenobacter sp. SG2305]
MIFATAGHVDHGKTALIAALTGTDTDRLPEEKRRGLTIDLGYAYLEQPDGRRQGFIDVPGHERFLGNMLAGMGGINHALLVVAADDGIMPQTREHLAILHLLAVPSATVVISKADLADADRLIELEKELHDLLTVTSLAGSPVLTVSAHTGTGLETLRHRLFGLPEPPRPARGRRFRLAVDRVFTVSGAGLVATGSALSGQIAVGDSLWLAGSSTPMRVRGLHAQNRKAERGEAGERLALNLAGDIDRHRLERGSWLLGEAPPSPTARISVQLNAALGLSKPLRHWQAIHLHHATSHVTGRLVLLEGETLAAGDSMLAELTLDGALYLAEGDRLILRDADARHTLAGARVVELAPPLRHKRFGQRLACLHERADALDNDDRQLVLLADSDTGVDLQAFAWARQLTAVAVDQLPAFAQLIRVADHAFTPERWQMLGERVLAQLAELHQQQPDQLGAGRTRLRRLALPALPEAIAYARLDQLQDSGALINSRGWLHLPGHVLAFSDDEARLWQTLEGCFTAGFEPSWVRDLALASGEDEGRVRQLLKKAARLGHVSAIVPDRYYLQEIVRQLAARVTAHCREHGHSSATLLRDDIGGGRKLAIQILEHFDRTGFTRRVGNRHLLQDPGLFMVQ